MSNLLVGGSVSVRLASLVTPVSTLLIYVCHTLAVMEVAVSPELASTSVFVLQVL